MGATSTYRKPAPSRMSIYTQTWLHRCLVKLHSGTRRSSVKPCLTFSSLCVGAQRSVLIMRSGHHDSCTRSSNSSCDPYGYACRCVRQRGHTKVNLSISRVHRNKLQRCSLRTNGISSRVYGSILISGSRVKSEMPPCR